MYAIRSYYAASEAPAPAADKGPWAERRARMTAAIAQFDEERLEEIYSELLALHPIERVTRNNFV